MARMSVFGDSGSRRVSRPPVGNAGGGDEYGVSKWKVLKIAAIVLAGLIIAIPISLYFSAVHPGQGELTVIINKTGKDLSNDMVLAPNSKYKGVQIEQIIQGPTFEFWNPYSYDWKTIKATIIPSMKVAVPIRKYGQAPPAGEMIARDPNVKGIVEQVIAQSGLQFLNIYAYDYEIHDLVSIENGFAGLVVNLVGPLPKDPNGFVVKAGERGVQPFLLKPGTYTEYSNPYIYEVIPIDVRSKKLDTSGQYSIAFQSKDGYMNTVEATIEWAPILVMLPETAVKYVEGSKLKNPDSIIGEIQRKLIVQFARSYFRNIGGGHYSGDFITGETKAKVQVEVGKRLTHKCLEEGIEIRAFVIRAVRPSEVIAAQYSLREVAKLQIARYNKEIETEIGKVVMKGATPKLGADGKLVVDEFGNPVLVGGAPVLKDPNDSNKGYLHEGGKLAKIIQERQKDRAGQLGEVKAKVAVEIRKSEEYANVAITQAQTELEIAKRELKAAQDLAAAKLAKGQAEAAVVVMKNKAEAEGIEAKASAFEKKTDYAQFEWDVKMAGSVRNVLSDTNGIFAQLFSRIASPNSGEKPIEVKK